MKLDTGKLAIPAEIQHVSRPRLLDVLQGSLASCCATIINGRAGTGKTTLAADFAQRCNRSVAWYKVDATDSRLSVFLEYLMASVEYERQGFGAKTRKHFSGMADEFSLCKLVEAFAYDLESEVKPLLLVLDDLHLIYDAEWFSPFIHRLLPLLPTEVHLLILGRGLPPAPLWRLRSKQRLSVINEEMLAFTQSEAEALFSLYGLSSEQAKIAFEQTGGRADDLHAKAVRRWSPISEFKYGLVV
ncbi:MAG: AAA family ATPase [Acidobacteria bacterium]|nr:AAA family ATPase [Acidobacteriota bacterium]